MATVSWTDGTGNWSTTSDWSTSALPSAGDDVVLPALAGGYVVTLDIAATPNLDSLTIDGNGGSAVALNVTSNALNVLNSSGSEIIAISGLHDQMSIAAGGSVNAGTIQLAGDGDALSLAGGQINSVNGILFQGAGDILSGAGTVVAGAISGGGQVEAADGGTLAISATVLSGVTLAVASGSDLLLAGTVAAASPIALTDATETLEIGAAAAVTLLSGSEEVSAGTIKLDGGTFTVAPSGGVLVDAGANLVGIGTVSAANFGGSGVVVASNGGVLDITSAGTGVLANTLTFVVQDGGVLRLDDQIPAGLVVGFAAGSTSATVQESSFASNTTTSETIGNMSVASAASPEDKIDFISQTLSFVSATGSGTTGGTVTLFDGATSATVQLNLTNIGSSTWNPIVTSDGAGGTVLFLSQQPCYCRGTLIRTEGGEVPVEQLAIGDRVVTVSGEAKPIKWVGRRSYDGRFIAGNPTMLPVRVAAGALADGIPSRDLWVSPEHALFVGGALVPAQLLVNGSTIVQVAAVDEVEYFHVELDQHDVMFAESAPAESYIECDNRGTFQNADEFFARYPEYQSAEPRFCAPRLAEGTVELATIRSVIDARAEALLDRVRKAAA